MSNLILQIDSLLLAVYTSLSEVVTFMSENILSVIHLLRKRSPKLERTSIDWAYRRTWYL